MSAQDRLERLAARAREAAVRGRREREGRRAAPVTGDVLRFAETAHLGVLWAPLEKDFENRRFLAVAADLCPLAGRADVTAPPGEDGEALTLRCGVAVWLDAEDFEDASWVGSLDMDVLSAARRKRAEVASGRVSGGLFARETDIDPEYHDWMEDGPERARSLMAGRGRRVLAFEPPPRRDRFLGVPASLAASVLLVVSLGLLAGLVWQGRELGRREAPSQVNLPFARFAAGQVRDAVVTLVVPSSAASFLLLFETDASYPAYRLEIRGKDDDVVVWSSEELRPVRERESRLEPIVLSVLLPRRLFDDGEYRVRLSGLRGGVSEELREAVLRLEVEQP